jgi:hypothetical protein
LKAQTPLLQVRSALDAFRFLLGAGQGRQQHRGQNGNDGNDDEQFNQRESPLTVDSLRRWLGHYNRCCGNAFTIEVVRDSHWPTTIRRVF